TPAPLPTLEDYSDGTSRWVESLLASWKAGAIAPELFARPLSWNGPLPGDSLTPAGARPPLSIAVYREGSAPPPAAASAAGADLAARLAQIRSTFASLGRTETTIFDFRKRGANRELVINVLLSGRTGTGTLAQEGGRIRVTLAPRKDGGWVMT